MTQAELNALINSKWLASPLAGETSLKLSTLPIPPSDSSVTQKGGFGGDFKIPLSSSGQPVQLEGMNTLLEFASASQYCHNVGLKKGFIADESSAIGGYPKGALLWYRVPNLSGSRVAGTYNDAETLRRSVTYQGTNNIQYYDFLVESMVDNNTANFQSDPLLIDGVQWRALPNQVFQRGTSSNQTKFIHYATGESINYRENATLARVSTGRAEGIFLFAVKNVARGTVLVGASTSPGGVGDWARTSFICGSNTGDGVQIINTSTTDGADIYMTSCSFIANGYWYV